MDTKSTKEVILDKALCLFSEKGYHAVSVASIAAEVGIKAPSLYKHYKSKQDIFDAIVEEIMKRYQNQMNFMQMGGMKASDDIQLMVDISSEHLVQLGKQLFLYFLHDEYTCQFRKMMTIEQYRDVHLANQYAKQYIYDPLSYQKEMFQLLIHNGTLMNANPEVMAAHFYGPMYLQIIICDNHPDKESEALLFIEKHIQQFVDIYSIKGKQ